MLPKSSASNISVKINIPQRLTAPLKAGDVVGEVIYSSGKDVIGKSDIIVEKNVDKMSFGSMIMEFFEKFASIF